MIDVTLRDEPAFTVAALPHHGPYNEIARTYGKLGGALGAARIMPGPGIAFYYDDPSQVAPADLRSHAGVTVAAETDLPEEMDRIEVAPGLVAIAIHEGSYAEIGKTWDRVYQQWLPQSGYEPAERAPYERYLNSPMDTEEPELRTEIVIPLKG